jgi:hypothetical protein
MTGWPFRSEKTKLPCLTTGAVVRALPEESFTSSPFESVTFSKITGAVEAFFFGAGGAFFPAPPLVVGGGGGAATEKL